MICQIRKQRSLHVTCAWYLLLAYKVVPHPDIFWYCLNGMGAQKNMPKNVFVTLFPFMFHIKTK